MKVYTAALLITGALLFFVSLNRSTSKTTVYIRPSSQQVSKDNVARIQAFIKTTKSNPIFSAQVRFEYDPDILEFVGAVPTKNCDALPNRVLDLHDKKNASVVVSQSVNAITTKLPYGDICFIELAFTAKNIGTGVIGVSGITEEVIVQSKNKIYPVRTTQKSTTYVLVDSIN